MQVALEILYNFVLGAIGGAIGGVLAAKGVLLYRQWQKNNHH